MLLYIYIYICQVAQRTLKIESTMDHLFEELRKNK